MIRTRVVGISQVIAVVVGIGLASLAWAASASAASAPSIKNASVSKVTATDATLEAQINPNGLETTYQFNLESGCGIEKPEPGHGAFCLVIVETSVPPGQIPPSSEDQTVKVDLNAAGVRLHPDTEYRYSVKATNSAGSTMQELAQVFKQTFTTQGPPSIESESVSNITPTDATLEAQINSEGLETTYAFKMWASPCSHRGSGCELIMDVPLPTGKLLGSFVGQSVSLDLNSAGVTLTPGGEYGYSVTATNAAGSVESPWHHFEPLSLNAQTNGAGGQVTAIDSPPAASLVTATGSPLSHHRKHKIRRHRREGHRARHGR